MKQSVLRQAGTGYLPGEQILLQQMLIGLHYLIAD